MCRIKFQGESLGTFLLYEVVIDAIIVDLGVIGSPEPVRIVTVKTFKNVFKLDLPLQLNYSSNHQEMFSHCHFRNWSIHREELKLLY